MEFLFVVAEKHLAVGANFGFKRADDTASDGQRDDHKADMGVEESPHILGDGKDTNNEKRHRSTRKDGEKNSNLRHTTAY